VISIFSKRKPLNPQVGVLILLVLLMALVLLFFHQVLLPFVLAIFLAYLLDPVVDHMNRWTLRGRTLPRGLAIIVIYLVIVGLLVLAGYALLPRMSLEITRMVKTLPNILRQVENGYVIPIEDYLNRMVEDTLGKPETEGAEIRIAPPSPPGTPQIPSQAPPTLAPPIPSLPVPVPAQPAVGTTAPLNPVQPPPILLQSLLDDYTYEVRQNDPTHFEVIPKRRKKLVGNRETGGIRFDRQMSGAFSQFRSYLEENVSSMLQWFRQTVRVLIGSVFSLFLVMMLSGFLLLDPDRIGAFYKSLVPVRYHGHYEDWLRQLDRGLSGVVRGQAMICLVNGILTGVGIFLMGVPYAFTLSVIAAIFSLIPIFGVLISSVPILLMGLTVSLSTAMLALGWILVIHFIEGNFLNPKILGDSARIHPVLIVFALLVGERFGGVLGALLAVPVFSLLQNSFLFIKYQAETMEEGV